MLRGNEVVQSMLSYKQLFEIEAIGARPKKHKKKNKKPI